MENTENGNAGPAVRMEPANSSGPSIDLSSLQAVDSLRIAQTCIERAQDRLRYGRRQEAEEAISFLDEASQLIEKARAAGQG